MKGKIKLELSTFIRIAEYFYLFSEDEVLSKDIFKKTFGNVDGEHYYNKWIHLYKKDLMKMITYFGENSRDGQLFCDMLSEKINQFEDRINTKK